MAIYKGKTPLASNGATPYVNPLTNNWMINGEDTGVQAFPDMIDVDEYSEKLESGTLDKSRQYIITGTTPRTIKNVRISTSDWLGSNPAVATIYVPNLKQRDVVSMSVSTSLSDHDLNEQIHAISSAQIKKIVCMDGMLRLTAYGDTPSIDVTIDLIIFKSIPNN